MAKIRLIYNRKNTLNKYGKAPIEIRIAKKKSTKYISTKVFISPDEWDEKKQRINNRNPHNIKLNLFLYKKIEELEGFEYRLIANDEYVNAEMIQKFATGKIRNKDLLFTDWARKVLEGNNTITIGTRRHRETFIRRIERFNPKLVFSEINYAFMREFERFLHAEVNPVTGQHLQQISIHGQMKMLKNFLYEAQREELIATVPNYRVEKGENVKEALTESEIERIENLAFPENSLLKKVRDMFLFSSYTALRFSDIENLNSEQIRLQPEGIELFVKMHKVKKTINLKLWILFDGKPEKIFKEYLEKNTEKIFEAPPNQTTNRNLKLIRIMAGIQKPLTFHISRHTCLTLIGKKTGNPFLIMKIAGHSDIKTSMRYTQGVVDDSLYDLL